MKKPSNFLWPLAFFLLVAIFFFWPVFLKGYTPFPGDLLVGNYEPYKSNSYLGWGPGGVPHKAQGPDVIRELYPWKFFAIESLKKGEFPFWNPYFFSGNPQLANFQTAVFYPLNLFFFLFSFNLAWTIFIFMQPVMAGLFTYLFAKEIGLRKIPAVFSGLVFAFSSYMSVWIEYGNIGHAILWLPLALYIVEKLIQKFSFKKIVFLTFVLTFSILAGYIQGTIYLFGTVFFYFLFRFLQGNNHKISNLLIFSISLTTSFFLSVIQLLPTWELFQLSARGVYPREELFRLLSPLYYAITTFVPDFFGHPASRNFWFWGTYIERVSYIGVIPLLLVFLSFFGKRTKNFHFFAVLGGVSYLLSLNILPTRWLLGLNPPILSTTVPTRILSLFCFSGSIMAGMGLNFWLEEKSAKKIIKIVGLFISLYLLIWLFIFLSPKIFSHQEWTAHLGVSKRNLFLPTVFAVLGGLILLSGNFIKQKKILALMIVFLTIFDLYFFFQKITPFSPAVFIYPKTPVVSFLKDKAGIDRFWGYGIASIETNFASYEKVYATDGSDALHIKRYGELISASKDGKVKIPVPRRDANIASGYGMEDLKNNLFRRRIIDLLGVKYILHKNEGLPNEWQPDSQTFPSQTYELVWQEGVWQVYKNKQAMPRIFLTSDYVVEKDSAQIIRRIFDKDFDLKTLILEEEINGKVETGGESRTELKSYTPNKIIISVTTEKPQLLFLSDNYYPGWQAFVDREETKIYRADYSFRAVFVPAGSHEIIFVYKPRFWLWN